MVKIAKLLSDFIRCRAKIYFEEKINLSCCRNHRLVREMKIIFVKIIAESISVTLIDAGHTYDVIPLYYMHVSYNSQFEFENLNLLTNVSKNKFKAILKTVITVT